MIPSRFRCVIVRTLSRRFLFLNEKVSLAIYTISLSQPLKNFRIVHIFAMKNICSVATLFCSHQKDFILPQVGMCTICKQLPLASL